MAGILDTESGIPQRLRLRAFSTYNRFLLSVWHSNAWVLDKVRCDALIFP